MGQLRSLTVKTAGLVALFVALYDLWMSLEAIRLITARGSTLSDALFDPPTSIIRIVACAFVLLGATLIIASKRIGVWILIPGTIIYAVLVLALATQSYGTSIWQFEALRLSTFLALLALIAAIRPFRRKSSTAPD